MSNRQYINDLADFYSSHRCINQKHEIIASPSYLSHYKNKTEEQILYEYLKEKHGYAENRGESELASSSKIEKDVSGAFNREPARPVSNSRNNREASDEYPRGQNSSEKREIPSSMNYSETKRPGYSPQDAYEPTVERRSSNPKLNVKEEEEPPKEEPKPKKSSNLLDRLNAKKGMNSSKSEKVKDEQDTSSIPAEKIKAPIQEDSLLVRPDRNEECNDDDVQESTSIKSGFISDVVNKESQRKISRPQEQPVEPEKEPFSSKQDILDEMSFYTHDGSFLDKSQYKRLDIEEPSSLLNQVSSLRDGPKRENMLEMMGKGVSDSQREPNERVENFRKHISSELNSNDEAIQYGQSSGLRHSSRLQMNEDEVFVPNQVDHQERQKKKLTSEKEAEEREDQEEYAGRAGNSRVQSKKDSMRESQTSSNPRQRETEERNNDNEIEHRAQVIDREDYNDRSQFRSKKRYTEELERENSDKRREYSNENIKMTVSQYENQKDNRYYDQNNTGNQESQPTSALGKPAQSESSITESIEKKTSEKAEKAGVRSVPSYLKNIEEMLVKLLAKQEVLEDNQRKILQAQKRQEEAIDEIRLQMTE